MKNWLIVSGLVLVALVAVAASNHQKAQEQKPEFVIDSYEFTWHIAQAGDIKLDVAKTEDTLRVELAAPDNMDFLTFDGPTAEAVGGMLPRTEEFYQKIANSPADVSETLRAAKWQVIFISQPEVGFWISVRPDERLSFTSLQLERKEAVALAPHLQKATRMLRFLDERIRP